MEDRVITLTNALCLFEEIKMNCEPNAVLACWFYDNESLIDQTIIELQSLLEEENG